MSRHVIRLHQGAQHVGDRICTLAALKAVTQTWSLGDTGASNYPSMLRCTIRLIHMVGGDDSTEEEPASGSGFVEDICTTFEKGTF